MGGGGEGRLPHNPADTARSASSSPWQPEPRVPSSGLHCRLPRELGALRAGGAGSRAGAGVGDGSVGTRRAAARALGSPAPLSTCPYREPEAAGAPEGRRAWARGPALWARAAPAPNAGRGAGGMGGGPAAAAAGWERGGGAARGRGAAAEEEEPGPPQPLTATGVNKQRRRGPAAAPARSGAGAQAEPCPWSRAGPRPPAAPPRLRAVTLLLGAGTAPSPGPPPPGSPLGRGAPEPPRRSPGKVTRPGSLG